MHTETTITALRGRLKEARARGARIGLIPTMGNLHQGHLALVHRARELADYVVVSIFVNPLQFGPNEDFQRYPRTLAQDTDKLESAGVELLFAPPVNAVYPKPLNKTVRVVVPELGDLFCGVYRPGHFVGVATVVNMLFNLVQPDYAVFGQKDYQQLLVVRRMAEDLHLPVQVLSTPTVRHCDGLAMSSRNAYLREEERQQAPRLYQTLCWAREQLKDGETDREALERQAADSLGKAGFRVEYFAIRRAA